MNENDHWFIELNLKRYRDLISINFSFHLLLPVLRKPHGCIRELPLMLCHEDVNLYGVHLYHILADPIFLNPIRHDEKKIFKINKVYSISLF